MNEKKHTRSKAPEVAFHLERLDSGLFKIGLLSIDNRALRQILSLVAFLAIVSLAFGRIH